MADEAVLGRLVATTERLWDDGCPVAGDGRRVAVIALRSWRSFKQRAGLKHPTFDKRVADLAKGLRDGLEPEPAMCGPLMRDYRDLARALDDVLS